MEKHARPANTQAHRPRPFGDGAAWRPSTPPQAAHRRLGNAWSKARGAKCNVLNMWQLGWSIERFQGPRTTSKQEQRRTTADFRSDRRRRYRPEAGRIRGKVEKGQSIVHVEKAAPPAIANRRPQSRNDAMVAALGERARSASPSYGPVDLRGPHRVAAPGVQPPVEAGHQPRVLLRGRSRQITLFQASAARCRRLVSQDLRTQRRTPQATRLYSEL